VRCRGQHSDRAGSRECRHALGEQAHAPSVERREEPQREQEDVDRKRCWEQPALQEPGRRPDRRSGNDEDRHCPDRK
jgi:hypothetical protein